MKMDADSFLRFLIVGFLTFIIYTAINVAAIYFNVAPDFSAGLALIAAGTFNYVGHRIYTFRSKRAVKSSLPRYVVLLITNALFAIVIVRAFLWLGLSLIVANLICISIITIATYLLFARYIM